MKCRFFLSKNDEFRTTRCVVLLAAFMTCTVFISACDKQTPLNGEVVTEQHQEFDEISGVPVKILAQYEIKAANTIAFPGELAQVSFDLFRYKGESIEAVTPSSNLALNFSFGFDARILSAPSIQPGNDSTWSMVTIDSSQVLAGYLGCAMKSSTGRLPTLGAPQTVLTVHFAVSDSAESGAVTSITFGNQPIQRTLSNGNGAGMATKWTNGTVTIVSCAVSTLEQQIAAHAPGIDTRFDFPRMRQFRDGFMSNYEEGREYIAMYYAFGKHFKTDWVSLRESAAALPHLYKAMDALERGSAGEMIVTPELHRSMSAVLVQHHDVNDASFQKIVARLESDLNAFRGMPKKQVLSRLTPARNEAANKRLFNN